LSFQSLLHALLLSGVGAGEMGVLANFKVCTKVFVALVPLAAMVVLARLYSSIEMKGIDTRYGDLLARHVKARVNVSIARAYKSCSTPSAPPSTISTPVARLRS
jgi:hypothetical protein